MTGNRTFLFSIQRDSVRATMLVGMMLCALFSTLHVQADSPANTPKIFFDSDNALPVSVGTNMLYLEDPNHTLSVDLVLNEENLPWKKIDKASPNFGFTESAYWFMFDVVNQASDNREAYIELPIPFLDKVNLYRLSEDSIIDKFYVGDERAYQDRPIEHQKFILPFQLSSGVNRFLMRIESAGTIEAPLSIWNPKDFLVADGDERMTQGIWFGAMAIMVIYNLFLLALLRDTSYFHYVFFTFSYLMFQASLKGYGFAYLWPNSVVWNSYAISVFIAGSNFFAVKLVIHFLDLAKHSRRAFVIASTYANICGLVLLLSFIVPYSLTVRLNSALALLTCIYSLSLGYWSWYHNNPLAKYFCLAWTSAFTGVAILVASKFGLIPSTFWTDHAGQIGVLAQVALLSFALASRFDREKEMRLKAQESSLEHERLARQSQDDLLRARADANAKLEQQVQERTENLQTALSELENVNKQLEVMSTTDSLTGIFNRRHFENCFAEEFNHSLKHKRTLSIVLCDIDHFKSINDQNGHQAGDECLQAIAKLLKAHVGRSGDLIARYGGEEFIVLLEDTSMHQAAKIAEDLRACVERLNFRFNGKLIDVTASFGVSALRSDDIQSVDQLVTQADLALYQAKNSGRNKVVCWDENSQGLSMNQHISSSAS